MTPIPKQSPIRSKAIRNAAQGEKCTVEIITVCNGDPDTTVLAHLPDESHGISRKSDDLSACFACSGCHRVIDGVDSWPGHEDKIEDWYLRRALVRTWRRLIALGVVEVKP